MKGRKEKKGKRRVVRALARLYYSRTTLESNLLCSRHPTRCRRCRCRPSLAPNSPRRFDPSSCGTENYRQGHERDSLRRCCPSSARHDRPRFVADCRLRSDRDSFATAAIAGHRTTRSAHGATGCRRRSDRGSARTDPPPLSRFSSSKTRHSLPERCSTLATLVANLKVSSISIGPPIIRLF